VLALPLAIAFGYLLGSIPTSVFIGRRLAGIDVRRHGSGNAGAANTLRLLGWEPALLVLLVDVGKGWLAARGAAALPQGVWAIDAEWLAMAAGLAAVLGHLWPVFAGFRGGKGAATSAGVMLALYPQTLALAVPLFVAVVAWTRRVSLGSVIGALGYPLALLIERTLLNRPVSDRALVFAAVLATLVVLTHRENLRRVRAGTEPGLGE